MLVVEENLLWSVRVANAARALGHEADTAEPGAGLPQGYDVAIVGLGTRGYDALEVVRTLVASGTKVVAHAGHKDAALLNAGREAGAHRVATNGEVAMRLGPLLAEQEAPGIS